MADTGREGFQKLTGSSITPPIPDFPKLPECLSRNKSDEDKAQIEEYNQAVKEFFRKFVEVRI